MNRKFKLRWLTIPLLSIKRNNHFSPQFDVHKKDLAGNPGRDLGVSLNLTFVSDLIEKERTRYTR